MGGFLFIAGVLVAVTVGYLVYMSAGGGENEISPVFGTRLFAGVVMALAFAFLGFVDDYIKVVKKRNLGLTAGQKMVMQILIAAIYLIILYLAGDTSTVLRIPFIGSLDLGLFYYPVALFILIVGTVNAVNLTDGIDGLAGSVTFIASLGFMVIAALLSVYEMQLLAVAVAGAMLGFLVWNFHPAKVFMGDTGSLAIGGAMGACAILLQQPLIMVIAGLLFVIEAVSVILQVSFFKLTKGKRLFRMAPIHHHFELCGWSERKVVVIFWIFTLLCSLLAYFSLK